MVSDARQRRSLERVLACSTRRSGLRRQEASRHEVVADAFETDKRQLTRRVVRKAVYNPLTPVLAGPIAYGLMQVEQVLEKKIGQRLTHTVFSRPAMLGFKVGTRYVPYVGWGLLAYDAYKILRD